MWEPDEYNHEVVLKVELLGKHILLILNVFIALPVSSLKKLTPTRSENILPLLEAFPEVILLR
jgi:hypothetical protein